MLKDDTQTINISDAVIQKESKSVQRSAAYPFITIKDLFDVLLQLYKCYPGTNTKFTRDDAAAVLKISQSHRYLAAGVHYGLIDREAEGYSFTGEFIKLYKPVDNELAETFLKAFKTPKLYQDLIAAFDGHVIPADLPTILYRKHEIAEKASVSAAEVFINNGKEIGVINENGILNVSKAQVSQENTQSQYTQFEDEIASEANGNGFQQSKGDAAVTIHGDQKTIFRLPPHELDEETLPIRLTDKKTATLVYPLSITKKDIEIIKKQLDVLDFLIDAEKEGTT